MVGKWQPTRHLKVLAVAKLYKGSHVCTSHPKVLASTRLTDNIYSSKPYLTKSSRPHYPIQKSQHRADILFQNSASTFSATTGYAHPRCHPNAPASASWPHRSKCAQIWSTSSRIRTKELDREQKTILDLQSKVYEPAAPTSLRSRHW